MELKSSSSTTFPRKEEAAKVLSHLDDKMIEQVVYEMSQIRMVSKFKESPF